MILLNVIYFLIITYLGFDFLRSDGKLVKGVMDSEEEYHYSGPELFWCLTFSTGLLAFSANVGLDLMAIRLGVLEILCIIGLNVAPNRPVISLPIKIYIIYLIWLLVGCMYGTSAGYGFRVILKYLYPLVLCLFASAVVHDSEVFLKSSLWARKVALISIIFSFVPLIGLLIPGVFWYSTAAAINYISIMIFSLSMFFFSDEKKNNLLYVILFMLPCFLWVFRTSIVGSALALMVFFLFKYKIKAIPVVVAGVVLFIALLFAIPSVREKMFYSPEDNTADMVYSGQISADKIDSNGRFAMWEWSLKKFWEPNKLNGAGTGNLQKTFYELRHPFGTIKICHNDYVQILCDNGLIGIILFGGSFLLIIFHCFKIYNNEDYPIYIRMCAITAGASLAGMMFTMYTDNVVNYSMATLSMPLGFYGMALGMCKKYDDEL